MATGATTVVFVGLTDLARITGKTRQRFSQLQSGLGKAGSVLPEPDALINQSPAWALDSIAPALKSAKYSLDSEITAKIRTERAVPLGTVPVGAYEAAEVLGGIPLSTLHSRSQDQAIAKPLFVMARKVVWDMDELVLDARSRGFVVDDEAVVKWRNRNGGISQAPWREVEISLRVTTCVSAFDSETAMQNAAEHVRQLLLDAEPIAGARVRVIRAEADTLIE